MLTVQGKLGTHGSGKYIIKSKVLRPKVGDVVKIREFDGRRNGAPGVAQSWITAKVDNVLIEGAGTREMPFFFFSRV